MADRTTVPIDDFHEALRLLRIPMENNGAYLISATLADGHIKAEYAKVVRVDHDHIESNGHTATAADPGMCVCGDPFPHRTTLKVI